MPGRAFEPHLPTDRLNPVLQADQARPTIRVRSALTVVANVQMQHLVIGAHGDIDAFGVCGAVLDQFLDHQQRVRFGAKLLDEVISHPAEPTDDDMIL